jgi:hypothetical protein
MRKYIAYTLLILTTSSCVVQTKTVNVDVLIPSPERLSLESNERIMLVANYRYHNKIAKNHSTAFVEDSIQVYKTANNFCNYFRSLETFSQNYVRIGYRPISLNEPDLLSVDEIKRYSILENPKYIVELSLLRTVINKVDPTTYKVSYASLWHVYDVAKGEMIRELLDRDSLFYDQYEKVPRAEIDSLIAENVANRIAEKVGYSILPFWQEEFRYYLTIPDPNFQKVNNLIQTFKWQEVINLMQTYLSSEDKNEIYAATYNIALACEMLGNINLAKKWLEKSKNAKNSYVVSLYLQALEAREKREKLRMHDQQSE